MPYTLTTPLYYVNDRPHLGSTYTTLAWMPWRGLSAFAWRR